MMDKSQHTKTVQKYTDFLFTDLTSISSSGVSITLLTVAAYGYVQNLHFAFPLRVTI